MQNFKEIPTHILLALLKHAEGRGDGTYKMIANELSVRLLERKDETLIA